MSTLPDENIHSDWVEIALDRVEGTAFERFVHAFYPSLAGIQFVPLGGMHDGGADAYRASGEVWEDGHAGIFYQASIQADHKTKIHDTIKALKKGHRSPTSLYYLTSRRVTKPDAEERRLSRETGVLVRLHDRSYIAAHVNDSHQTRDAFRQHLGPILDSFKRIGAAQVIGPSRHVKSPAVYVFLRQEVERRSGDRALTDAIVDSLILWALEGTDPDLKKFRTRKEISDAIQQTLPFAGPLIQSHLNPRLTILSSKGNPSGREIRHHQKEDLFCLPYETRKEVEADSAADEALRIRVLSAMEDRISAAAGGGIELAEVCCVANLAMRTLQLTFEREGLEFAAFLENKQNTGDYPIIADHADFAIIEAGVKALKAETYKAAILEALRTTFYKSTPDERLFLGKLAHTYALLFSLQAEPRIAQYFEEMASDFFLYVGADLIVRALSERYVRPEDQRVRTLLKMLASAGSRLVLTEPVLQELQNHLISSDAEFRHYFAAQEKRVTYHLARNCPKILIRAYFYTKFDPPEGIKSPESWQAYLGQFCTASKLRTAEGKEELRRYLLSAFGLTYQTRAEIEQFVTEEKDKKAVDDIAARLSPEKATNELALNDALMSVAVYGRRRQSGEMAKQTVFGYRTWWLTGETTILRYTRDLVSRHGGRYIMRPEFLLNFIAMAPKLGQVRAAYNNIFPSLLGIQLANRVKEDVYQDMMKKVTEATNLESSKQEAVISLLSDKLKSDFRKVHQHAL